MAVKGGRVRGVRRDDLWTFSGIPYGRAPVGALRWRPPEAPEPWDGVRDASSFGPIAPQAAGIPGFAGLSDPQDGELQSEDCLSLNIWTPDVPDRPSPVGARAVMVWIHGGGFTGGSGSNFLYRGAKLARQGDLVVVTINYRLGALGFLGHRALADPDGYVGNWGLHDQVAALEWVRDHIALFGGDSSNVTVFGESAGGFSVATLLGTPGATGLFRRAIVQSGGVHVHTVAEGERTAERVTELLGLTSCDRAALESVSAQDLVEATTVVSERPPDPGLVPLPHLPIVDHRFLPEHPMAAIERGAARNVELLIGTNKDELTLFGLGNPVLGSLDEPTLELLAGFAAPDMPTAEMIETYRAARLARDEPVAPLNLWWAMGGDDVFRWRSLQLAAAQRAHGASAYVYLFDWESPALGGVLGSCHALEIPFVFGAVDLPVVQMFTGTGPLVEALSAEMLASWIAFAHSGDPTTERHWPIWEPDARATMVFGPNSGVAQRPRDAELAVWEQYRPLVAGRQT